ncbi:MAG: Signal recognition particle 54 kDa protein [Candidatus Heimdallarchaeota archaeon LC_2]|uniref:signal-recognition-particle GTPase n=1 Tax=uncultured organism TaxID=155900 RepID=A0A0F6PXG4_9ZZZZ|nr:putative Signal recognition particle 54 kDa protein [uncultured organism]OLS23319.1 MAG: Signal recognition particle 54 kDa protein [Candidatus Heimdallarchaeota archaeon LC_2]
MVLSGLGKSLSGAVNRILSRGPIDKQAILELKNEILRALLEADINFNLASQMAENLHQRALTEKPPMGISRKDAMVNIVYEELTSIMGGTAYSLDIQKKRVNILMMIGIQGSGKTTTIGKLAKFLKHDRWNVGLVCTDTWRPGALDQLKQLGDKVGVETFGIPEEKNAVKIASKGIKHLTDAGKNIIIVDTAGRHKEEKDLLKEMVKLDKKVKPDEIILVIDGTLGQSAFNQAKAFAQTTNIGSIIVTKLDGTAKGGGAISAAAATGAPIKFIGLGEDITELEKFDPKGFASRILGLGDITGIIDQVERAQIMPDEDRARAMMKGNVSYNDMLDLFKSMGKFGGIRKLLDKLPGGLSHNVDDNMLATSKESMKDFQNIILSMTNDERDAIIKLNRSRIDRIAMGAGVTSDKVRELVKQKQVSEKWIKQMMKTGKRRGKKGQAGLPFNMMDM